MSIRDNLDISAYLVLGPENTLGRPVGDVVAQALDAGFTCIQVRSKVASAREIIALTGDAAQAIAQAGKTDQVALLIDDRLDCVLAAREQGIAVDGVHVGQSDIPVEGLPQTFGPRCHCGPFGPLRGDARVRQDRRHELVDYLASARSTRPRPSATADARPTALSSPRALRTWPHSTRQAPCHRGGGGVKTADLPQLKATGVDGFFVVSAVCSADDPYAAAKELVDTWQQA